MPEYDLTYLKRKRRKKAVLVIMLIACICAIILALVALLARNPGAFTVNLNRGTIQIALGTKEEFTYEEGTGYLTTPKLPGSGYRQATYEQLESEGVFDLCDNEQVPTAVPSADADQTIPYYKYTFFVKNFGQGKVDFDVSLYMTSVGYNNTNEYSLDHTIRVGFYENRDLSKHERKFYARRSDKNVDISSTGEFIDYLPEYLSNAATGRLAEPFLSNELVLKSTIENLEPDDVVRYTFIFWVEGSDPECIGDPPNNTLRLEAKIDARESVEPPVVTPEP